MVCSRSIVINSGNKNSRNAKSMLFDDACLNEKINEENFIFLIICFSQKGFDSIRDSQKKHAFASCYLVLCESEAKKIALIPRLDTPTKEDFKITVYCMIDYGMASYTKNTDLIL